MKKEDKLPKVGDIIMSAKFAFGHYGDEKEKDCILISCERGNHRYTKNINEDERVRRAAKTGKIPPKTRVVDLGAYDKSRKTAKFVVEEAGWEGGGEGTRPGEYSPDEWCVTARRLKGDGSYDFRGEKIFFYLNDDCWDWPAPKDIKIVGKMKRRFV